MIGVPEGVTGLNPTQSLAFAESRWCVICGKVRLAFATIASARASSSVESNPLISADPAMRKRSPMGTNPNRLLSSMTGVRGALFHEPRSKVTEMPLTG